MDLKNISIMLKGFEVYIWPMDIIEDQAAKIVASHVRDVYNCTEIVLMAMQEAGYRHSLGTGIGRRDCGAVTGGIIAIIVLRITSFWDSNDD